MPTNIEKNKIKNNPASIVVVSFLLKRTGREKPRGFI
jgi:hypothetical protein